MFSTCMLLVALKPEIGISLTGTEVCFELANLDFRTRDPNQASLDFCLVCLQYSSRTFWPGNSNVLMHSCCRAVRLRVHLYHFLFTSLLQNEIRELFAWAWSVAEWTQSEFRQRIQRETYWLKGASVNFFSLHCPLCCVSIYKLKRPLWTRQNFSQLFLPEILQTASRSICQTIVLCSCTSSIPLTASNCIREWISLFPPKKKFIFH